MSPEASLIISGHMYFVFFRYIHVRIESGIMCRKCVRKLDSIAQNVANFRGKVLETSKRCLKDSESEEKSSLPKRRLQLTNDVSAQSNLFCNACS